MARVLGSYPIGRWFKSYCRYQKGPLVKRLRHRPFTAESWVQFPYGSPLHRLSNDDISPFESFLFYRKITFVLYLFFIFRKCNNIKGFSKNRNTSEISYMTNVSYKAANRSNTLCIARFDNAGNDICHRKFAVREVFRGSLKIFMPIPHQESAFCC